jgi:RNA recognition motif-containing protein
MTNIYVGNLPYGMKDEELRNLFIEYGAVSSAKVIIDRDTNRSKGFGFVEMDDKAAAQTAIDALNGTEFSGRALRVNEARPRESGGGGFGGGRGDNRGGFRRHG